MHYRAHQNPIYFTNDRNHIYNAIYINKGMRFIIHNFQNIVTVMSLASVDIVLSPTDANFYDVAIMM